MRRSVWILVTLVSGCGHAPERAGKERKTAPPVAVSTVAASVEEWASGREAVGTVRARTTGSVSSRIMAYVREVRVNTGDVVSAGQALLVLDSKELDAAYRQAEEAQREAQSAEAEVNGGIAAAKARLDLAQVTFQRMKDLFDKKSISNQELDEASAKLRLAEAGYDMARSKKQQLDHKIAQAGEALKNASIHCGYAEIAAPFAGMVTEKRVEPGNLATPGAPLLIVEQAGAYRLEVPVEESLLESLRRGQGIEVGIEALNRTVSAPIAEIVPAVDPASRSGIVKLDLPPLASLRSGMSGRAKFPAGVSNGLTIPADAIRTQGSLQFVMVADEGRARNRMIAAGERRRDRVRVLSGLAEGEKIVYPLPGTLADGAAVEVKQ
ncbi:MAG: efflux RND transporter periplasmic adaptor subunit [Acidobacteria bacterium]|nr:efflux RND transporter periplasmic adaptor subunit [Acidobacteriota bacterium]